VPEGERLLTVVTRPSTIGAAVEISDNGPGIPLDVLPRIFDPFFTTREVGEGTGLGLSMSYSIAQSHEGDLRVETRPNEKTTFTLDLPRAGASRLPADASAVPDAPAAADKEGSPESGPRVVLRILVVDDEQSVRGLARRFLAKRGHHVDEAESGKAALRMIQEREYDSVIVDLRMPDLSGEGLYEWLKKNRPALAEQVIVISGDIANPDTVEILERMGRPFLLKPFALDDLLRIIDGFTEADES
jgi:CheY-like chemotaxis protein